MKQITRATARLVGLGSLLLTVGFSSVAAADTYEIVGATHLPKDSTFAQAIDKFAEVLDQEYEGDLDIRLHYNAELGSEKDMFEYMMQGLSVDYTIMSPAWMANWIKTAALMDSPFLFEGSDHWKKAVASGAFESIEAAALKRGVRILGYGGGSERNLILGSAWPGDENIGDIKLRVQGSPIHQKVFSAVGFKAIPMAFSETYNAINAGVIDGMEGEPSGYQAARLYEVAPNYVLTAHQVVTRPIVFSEARLKRFPEDLQEAIKKAGAAAAEYHVSLEIDGSETILSDLSSQGINVMEYDSAWMKEKALPAVMDYASSIDGTEIIEATIAAK